MRVVLVASLVLRAAAFDAPAAGLGAFGAALPIWLPPAPDGQGVWGGGASGAALGKQICRR